MNEKRIRKLDPLKHRRDLFVVEGDAHAPVALVAWGSVAGTAREALELARREGIQAKLLVPKLLFPVAEEIYADFFRSVQAGLVVEQSHQGQLYRILRMYVNVPAGVQPLARSGSNPILPTSIVERLRQDRPRPAAAAGGRGGAGGLRERTTMSTITRPVEEYQAKDYKSDLKPIWCPGCGDFGVVQAIYRALASVGPAAARDRVRLGHRLLEPHPRLHDGLRLQQRPRPGAADRAGDQAREPGAARARGRAATATASRSAAATSPTPSAATWTSPTS